MDKEISNSARASYTLVNMEAEMYNDGQYFLQQSKNVDIEKVFEKWRYNRFSIISFALSFEAFINSRIVVKLGEIARDQEQNSIYKCLTKANYNFIPRRIRNMYDKIGVLEEIYGLEKDALTESEHYVLFYKEIIVLRNKIVHYSWSNASDVYGEKLNIAINDVVGFLRAVISDFSNKLNLDTPQYFLEDEYQSF